MSRRNTKHRQAIFHLISDLEAMSETGGVSFSHEQPYHDLMDYFEEECLLERALEVADYAINQYTCSVEFLIRKAELLIDNKQVELALATLDKVDAMSDGLLSTNLLRASALATLEMYEEAFDLLDQLKDRFQNRECLSDIFVCEALIYQQLKQHERVFYLLKAALEENPENDEALSRMWYCVESARMYEESVNLHEWILEEHPFCSLAWYNLGAANEYLCNHQEAIEAYEYSFLTNENFEFAYRDCAQVCLTVQDYKKALQCYQEVLQRFEPDSDLFLHIGHCYANLSNYLIAKTFYEKAVHFDPWCDEAFFRIGVCYAKQKKWQKAIAHYLKAIRIEDRQEEYHAALADAYCQVGDYKKAETFFREAADIAPEEPNYWIRYARFLINRKRPEEALEVLDEAEDYTYGSELLYCRSACLFFLERKQEALLALEDALMEDFYAHNSLFKLLPLLEQDNEVRAVIAVFQPD
jgi:tetratricopeptide (TPR) repeat protein